MLTMQFLIILTLFAVQSLAKPSVYEDFKPSVYEDFKPSVYEDFSDYDECKLDLLIIWDNSNSIGGTPFKDQVKPFFRNLINNEHLNVGPNGTHIAIITFSSQARTKVLLEFGNKTTKEDLLQYINELTWLEVGGAATRTGMALMLANQMFKQKAPLNGGKGRQNVTDIVMILTDGEPVRAKGDRTYGYQDFPNKPYEEFSSKRRSEGETEMANANAESLRDKGVRIVGVSIGRYGDLELLKKWTTTQSDAIQTDIAEFDKIVPTMVDESCKKTDCSCPSTVLEVQYAEPGKKAYVTWEVPEPSCKGDQVVRFNEKERIKNGHYGVGSNTIPYNYSLASNTDKIVAKCSVQFEVKECSCPSDVLEVQYAEPGEKAYIAWEVPEPSCTGDQVVRFNEKERIKNGYYGVGSHTIPYDYSLASNTDKIVAKCSVQFEVKDCNEDRTNPECRKPGKCDCGTIGTNVYLKTGKDMAEVHWVKPTLKCSPNPPVIVGEVVNPAGTVSPKSFGVGNHVISYTFEYLNGRDNLETHTCPFQVNVTNCSCPSTGLEVQYVEPGKTAYVTWDVPEPSCTGDQVVRFNEKERIKNGHYGVGSHTIPYNYSLASNPDKIVAKCSVQFEVKDCSCPSTVLEVQYAEPGKKAYVTWEVPEPSCTGDQVVRFNEKERIRNRYYGVGSHTIPYNYSLASNTDKIVAKCSVQFEVKDCKCPSKDVGVFSIRPQDGHVCPLIKWTRPTPNCPVLDNSSPRISGAGEKGTYAIGKHTVTYIYPVSNNLEVKCHVKLEMKVVECGDEEYDPDKKHCCYGKLHDKQNEVWKCCGIAYYNPKLHKCCDMENAYIVSKSGGECPCAINV